MLPRIVYFICNLRTMEVWNISFHEDPFFNKIVFKGIHEFSVCCIASYGLKQITEQQPVQMFISVHKFLHFVNKVIYQ